MPDQLTKERIDQEVVSANHDKLYQATKKEVDNNKLKAKSKPEPTLAELKVSHDNHFLNQQIEMMKKELITMVNEKGGE